MMRQRWRVTDQHESNGRSFADLLRRLRRDAMRLIRAEVELAKVEINANARAIFAHTLMLVIAGGVALLAAFALVGALSVAAAAGFATFMPVIWAAALGPLAVSVILGGIAFTLYRAGVRRMRRQPLLPQQTIATIGENRKWIEERLS